MNDVTTKSSESLHRNMQSLYEREARWMAVCASIGSKASGIAGGSSKVNYGDDAPKIERAADRKLYA